MKYYFFRDLRNECNLVDGCSFAAAGYVVAVHCDLIRSNNNAKDLAVKFFDPFEACIQYTWRALGDVELFEVDEFRYKQLVSEYKKIEDE